MPNLLHELSIEVIKSEFFQLLLTKFEQIGIELTSTQRESLREQIDEYVAKNESSELHLTLEHDTEVGVQQLIEIEINDEDNQLLHQRIDASIDAALDRFRESYRVKLLEHWRKHGAIAIANRLQEFVDYAGQTSSFWNKPLDLFYLFLGISLDLGATLNHNRRPQAAQENDLVFDVLTRLHARGCQIGYEIYLLLSHGFADGAHARWRTLHEISVVASFISTHGQKVAESYGGMKTS